MRASISTCGSARSSVLMSSSAVSSRGCRSVMMSVLVADVDLHRARAATARFA